MTRVASLFAQILQHLPKTEFTSLVKRHRAEYQSKGFTCWTQLVAMLYCHLAHADSLRDICNGLVCALGRMVHLGIGRPPNKSTLAYANEHRPAALFRDFFYATLYRFQDQGLLGKRKAKFKFKNKLLSLDATVLVLCLKLFPWAKFRRTKGGVKLHVLLDHDGYVPVFVHLTTANRHESTVAKTLTLPPDSIVAIDLGYTDYQLFGDWTRQGVWFVTRLKDNAVYDIVGERQPPEQGEILYDRIIRLTGSGATEKCPFPLRMVGVWDVENAREIVLLTNHLEFEAETISDIYKDRWEIELFFKLLKQQLKIKTFVGTSENALLIQIWTALIAVLLLKWLHFISTAGWSMSNMAFLLRGSLFTYRDLRNWLDDPWGTPPLIPETQQLALVLPGVGQLSIK